MSITVLFFAGLADKAGQRRLEVPHEDGDTVATVSERVAAICPVLTDFLCSVAYAVNEEYADAETVVPDGATVAFIPPVSGGSAC